MKITAKKLAKAFNNLAFKYPKLMENIGYQFYPTEEHCEKFEITIDRSVPDRPVAVCAIDLKNLDLIVYAGSQEVIVYDWDSDVSMWEVDTIEEIIVMLIKSALSDIRNLMDFEEYVCDCLETALEDLNK